ncbi:PIF1 helicase-like protein [Trypanosoma theileri]|uniref:MTOR-associated protein MEAK7 n=1 Tax=Trypanosoma theileri TaxID=67003 RepID=A0A1X0P7Q9_9TRYP|nr:PIF1 helicase-like protein [Trypanosoma theileri]ORC92972.1 PIF1 helicase-like protein [Trypanosoma theileri]
MGQTSTSYVENRKEENVHADVSNESPDLKTESLTLESNEVKLSVPSGVSSRTIGIPQLLGFASGEEVNRILPDSLSLTIANNVPSSCWPVSSEVPQWYLLYNSFLHGRSFQQLVQRLVDKGPTIIVIRSCESPVIFGGFCGDSWLTVAAREKQDKSRSAALKRAAREHQIPHGITKRPSNQDPVFFGSENCFLFSDRDGGSIYRPHPLINSNFMYLFDTHPLEEKIGIGMGGRPGCFGWFLDRWLETGASPPTRCPTFQSPPFTPGPSWRVDGVEAYALLPATVDTLLHRAGGETQGQSCIRNEENEADKMLLQLHGLHAFDNRERPDC